MLILLMPKCIHSGPQSVFAVLPNRYFKDGRIVEFSRVDQQLMKQERKEVCALEMAVVGGGSPNKVNLKLASECFSEQK